MSKSSENMQSESVQNEGDIIIEDLWNGLEKHKDIAIPANEAYEKARAHYVQVKAKFDETQKALGELEASIEAFEKQVVYLTGGKVTQAELTQFRENANAISVAFGKNAAFIQYTAASGVLFAEEVRKAAGEKH